SFFLLVFLCFFFFQAEDGIRDFHVTGVQTCALPIFHSQSSGNRHTLLLASRQVRRVSIGFLGKPHALEQRQPLFPGCLYWHALRSEERRVGKECRARVSACRRTKALVR